jgi:hypothetical protein
MHVVVEAVAEIAEEVGGYCSMQAGGADMAQQELGKGVRRHFARNRG